MVPSKKNSAVSENGTDISDDLIEEQLCCILNSPEFRGTEAQRDFLRFVVEETIAGRTHEIKAYTVATRVFGRKADFNPTIDPIVSVQANRLRLALELYYLRAGGQDPLRIDIPKGTYVPSFVEQESLEISKQKSYPAEQEEEACRVAGKPTIAVIPFTNLSEEQESAYFSLGLTEDLTIAFIRQTEMQVFPCLSDPPGNACQIDAKKVGKDWGVGYLLLGSVRKDAETIKINVRLIDTATGAYLWGEQYYRDAATANLIATQDQITREIVSRIIDCHGIMTGRSSLEDSQGRPPPTLYAY